MKRFFFITLIVITVGIGAFLHHAYRTQDQVIFRSQPLDKSFTYHWDHPFQEVFLETLEGTEINGLWFQTPNPKGVVLFFHGRGRNLNTYGNRAAPFIERGYDVFIIDYRGFGKSSRGFKEEWFLEDGDTAYHFLMKYYAEKDIIVYGHSMGTSIATWVAANHNPRLLILEAPFYSMLAAAHYTKPILPRWVVSLILKYHLRTDQWIRNVKAPVYIFHGSLDKVVPFEHSTMLLGIKPNAEFIALPDASHNDIHLDPIYHDKIQQLLP